MELDHAIVSHCCYEWKNRRGEVLMFLFITGEKGGEIFNTWTWEKKRNAAGQTTNEDDITVTLLMEGFEKYCLPKKNLISEKRNFFLRNQLPDTPIDAFITELIIIM